MIDFPFLFFLFLTVGVAGFHLGIAQRHRKLSLCVLFVLAIVIFFKQPLIPLGVATGIGVFSSIVGARRWRLLVGLIILGVLIRFKFPLGGASQTLVEGLPFLVAVPVGYSYQMFAAISMWIDQAKGKLKEQTAMDAFMLLTLAPAMVAGPYVPARDILFEINKESSGDDGAISWGVSLVLLGLMKKALADSLAVGLLSRLLPTAASGSSPAAMLALVVLSGRLYFDFSGYSDLARGGGLLFGISLPENFRRPYWAGRYTEFWSRWNQSLSDWFKQYVFNPLLARYHYVGRFMSANTYVFLITCLTCGLIALWHGIGLRFLTWFVLVTIGLWIRPNNSIIHRAFVFFWIFFSSSVVMSASVWDWLNLWVMAFSGGWGAMREWLFLVVVLGVLLSIQSIESAHLRRACGRGGAMFLIASTFIFLALVLGQTGRSFIYAGF